MTTKKQRIGIALIVNVAYEIEESGEWSREVTCLALADELRGAIKMAVDEGAITGECPTSEMLSLDATTFELHEDLTGKKWRIGDVLSYDFEGAGDSEEQDYRDGSDVAFVTWDGQVVGWSNR